jgi:hypothetical protein
VIGDRSEHIPALGGWKTGEQSLGVFHVPSSVV